MTCFKYRILMPGVILAFIMFNLFGSNVYAEPEVKSWLIAGDNQNSYLVGEIWHQENRAPQPVNILKSSFESTDPIGVISEFYKQAKLNATDKMAELLFEPDGSRERFKSSLQVNPEQYARFNKVSRVSVTFESLFGVYHAIGVRLFGANGSMDWQESVICSLKSCFISNVLQQPEPYAELFSAVQSDYFAHRGETKLGAPIGKKHLEDAAQISVLPELKTNDQGAKLYPIRISLNLSEYDQSLVFTRESGVWSSKHADELDELSSFVSNLWDIKNDTNHYENPSVIQNVLAQHWQGYTKTKLIRLFSQDKLGTKSTLSGYFPAALYQRINKWTAIKPIGIFKDADGDAYLFFRPIINGESDGVQVFPMKSDKTGTLKFSLLRSNYNLTTIIFSPQMISAVSAANPLAIQSKKVSEGQE